MAKIIKHRAVCDTPSCNFIGKFHESRTDAKADASKHKKSKPSHKLNIETKEIHTIMTAFK
jgi:hypothetical protein